MYKFYFSDFNRDAFTGAEAEPATPPPFGHESDLELLLDPPLDLTQNPPPDLLLNPPLGLTQNPPLDLLLNLPLGLLLDLPWIRLWNQT